MADYDCEYCKYEIKCKYAYQSTCCEFDIISKRDSNYTTNLRNCIGIIKQSIEQLKMFDEEDDFEDEIRSLNFTLNDMEYQVNEETENEWNEMTKGEQKC